MTIFETIAQLAQVHASGDADRVDQFMELLEDKEVSELKEALLDLAIDVRRWKERAKIRIPQHFGSVRCTVFGCRLPEHYVGGILP